MKASEPLVPPSGDRERPWRPSSRPAPKPGAVAWVLAVAVVGALALALHLLHG